MILTTATKEVVADAALGGAWVNRTPRKVIRTGVYGSTPEEVYNAVSVNNAPYPVIIGSVITSPPCGISRILQVSKKRQYNSPGLVRNTQKLDNVVDRNLPDDLDYAYIFSKVIGHKISDGSSDDIYSRCRLNFANDPIQTQAPHFMDMGLPTINILNESGVLGNPATKIQRPTDVSHWSAPDHVFGEATAVGMSAANSDHDYSYKTDFEIWRENQEFKRQNKSLSRPPLDSTTIGTNTTNVTMSHLESTPIETKMPDPKPLTQPIFLSKLKGKSHVPEYLDSDP